MYCSEAELKAWITRRRSEGEERSQGSATATLSLRSLDHIHLREKLRGLPEPRLQPAEPLQERPQDLQLGIPGLDHQVA